MEVLPLPSLSDPRSLLLPTQAWRRLRALCAELIRDTRARNAQASGATNSTADGKRDASIRSGCKPGSFLDLLIHATDKETGKPFTDLEVWPLEAARAASMQRCERLPPNFFASGRGLNSSGAAPIPATQAQFGHVLARAHTRLSAACRSSFYGADHAAVEGADLFPGASCPGLRSATSSPPAGTARAITDPVLPVPCRSQPRHSPSS